MNSFLNFLPYAIMIVGLIGGIFTILLQFQKISNFFKKYKWIKKIIPKLKVLFIILGVLVIFLFLIEIVQFKPQEKNSDKLVLSADPSCLQNSLEDNLIDFEWIINSEEEFESRITYFVIPYSSGTFENLPLFKTHWENKKIGKGSNTITNIINYSLAQRGRYKICAGIVNKIGEEELGRSCCIVSFKTDF